MFLAKNFDFLPKKVKIEDGENGRGGARPAYFLKVKAAGDALDVMDYNWYEKADIMNVQRSFLKVYDGDGNEGTSNL